MKGFILHALLACCAVATAATLTLAGPVTVVPGGSTVAGKAIGDWTADWWNWTGSVPGNVFNDTTGALATQNQSGPVFFVAGTQGTSVTRTFDIPGDKFVLFPLINFVVANGPDPGFPDTKTEATTFVDQAIDPAKLVATIDGTDVTGLASHRETSPLNFTYTVTAESGTFTPGSFSDANADGYWLMLNPLGSGSHTLHFGGTSNDFTGPDSAFHLASFTVDVTDNVTATGNDGGGGGTAIPLPAPAWNGLAVLALLAVAGLVRRGAASSVNGRAM
jgi:hypothetical protein